MQNEKKPAGEAIPLPVDAPEFRKADRPITDADVTGVERIAKIDGQIIDVPVVAGGPQGAPDFPPIDMMREQTYIRLRTIPPKIAELMRTSPIANTVMSRYLQSQVMYVEALEHLVLCLAHSLNLMTKQCLELERLR